MSPSRNRRVHLLLVVAVLVLLAGVVAAQFVTGTSRDRAADVVDTTEPGPTTTVGKTSPSTTEPPSPPPGSVVDPAATTAAQGGGTVPVVIRLDVTPTGTDEQRAAQVRAAVDRVLATLPAGSYTEVPDGFTVATVPMTVDAAGLDALSRAPSVTAVRASRTFQPTADAATDLETQSLEPESTSATTASGANVAWTAGRKGSGASVAVIDTGVALTHPFLAETTKSTWEGCFAAARSGFTSPCPGGVSMATSDAPISGSAAPCPAATPGCTHGTHVAGIAVGGTGTREVSGIAPAAGIVAINVFSYKPGCVASTGCIYADDNDIIRALQWLHNKRATFTGLASVNMSLGDSVYHPGYCDNDPLKPYIDQLVTDGIMTVVAAGNDSWANGVSSPACISTVIAVGATDDATNQSASFSNDGPQVAVMAPGLSICSSYLTGASGAGTCSGVAGDGTLGYMSGTSMATPAVAGALALLRAEGIPASDWRSHLQQTALSSDCILASAYSIPKLSVDVALGLTGQMAAPCPPGRPTASFVSPTSAMIAWQKPVSTGTGNLTTYNVSSTTGQSCIATPPATQCIVTGLSAGSVGFGVTATSTTGTSIASTSASPIRVGLSSGSPIGSFDAGSGGPGSLSVSGWAIDPDTASAISVHVYVDNGFAGFFTANLYRPDVGGVFPVYGNYHGYSGSVPATGGVHNVCVAAIDAMAPGVNSWIGCRSVTVPTGSPFGSLDSVWAGLGSVSFAGWTVDPDTPASLPVHVYIDGRWTGALGADGSRPDVAAAYPGYGANHGFGGSFAISGGAHTLCAYAIDIAGSGSNVLLGCRSVTVPTGSPFGSLDVAWAGLGSVSFAGWTVDPDTSASIPVHVYIDGRWGGAVLADGSRPDVGAAYRGYGANHGFGGSFALAGGAHTLCAYAIDIAGSGSNVLLGCRSVTVPTGSPFGSLDDVSGGVGSLSVSGWTIDPDTAASIPVHVYVDGGLAVGLGAGVYRPDVGAAFPLYGPNHGFGGTVSAGAGSHNVCVAAIDIAGSGTNTWLACRTVTVR